jgi:hypothetical protein
VAEGCFVCDWGAHEKVPRQSDMQASEKISESRDGFNVHGACLNQQGTACMSQIDRDGLKCWFELDHDGPAAPPSEFVCIFF